MANKYFIALIFFIPLWIITIGQPIKIAIPINQVDKIALDDIGHLYLSNHNGTIYKYDTAGHKLTEYSPRRISKVASLDASYPLRLFAFYAEYQKMVWLDRLLNPLSEVWMNNRIIGYATVACPSRDGNIWLFDESDFALKKINGVSGDLLFTQPLIQTLGRNKISVASMAEANNQLFVVDTVNGIHLFDFMGNLKRSIYAPSLHFAYPSDSGFYMATTHYLVNYNSISFKTDTVLLLQKSENILAILRNNKTTKIVTNLKSVEIYNK